MRSRRTVTGHILNGWALLLTLGILSTPGLLAKDFPAGPLRLIVPYPPGGATDTQARVVTAPAAEPRFFGQPIVVINKPGAGGRTGWNWFATRGEADGQALAVYNVPHFIAQSIVFKTDYGIRNLEPLVNWGADPAVLMVGPRSPFKNVADLLDFARRNPGKVTVSGAGLYVGHHIAMLQLEKAAGIDLTYVPTQGGVPAMHLVMGDKVMAGFNNLSDAYRSRDRIRILAVADLERNQEFLPEVPTFKELGIAVDDSSVNFRGVMVPAGTPQEIIDFLATRLFALFNDKETVKKMGVIGAPMRVMSRQEVLNMWRERQAYLAKLLATLRPS